MKEGVYFPKLRAGENCFQNYIFSEAAFTVVLRLQVPQGKKVCLSKTRLGENCFHDYIFSGGSVYSRTAVASTARKGLAAQMRLGENCFRDNTFSGAAFGGYMVVASTAKKKGLSLKNEVG